MNLFEVIFFRLFDGDFTHKIHFITQRPGNVFIRIQKVVVFDKMESDLTGIAHVLKDLFFEMDGEVLVFGDHFEDLNDFFT